MPRLAPVIKTVLFVMFIPFSSFEVCTSACYYGAGATEDTRPWGAPLGRLTGKIIFEESDLRSSHPCLVRDPVDFPRLAAILGERLFKVGHAGVGVRPDKSNKDAFPVQRVLAVELAASILRSEERRVGKECRSRWSPY